MRMRRRVYYRMSSIVAKLTVITTALVVDHLMQDLVFSSANIHLDWTTSFFSDTLILDPISHLVKRKLTRRTTCCTPPILPSICSVTVCDSHNKPSGNALDSGNCG